MSIPLNQINGFDEELSYKFSDIDLCLKIIESGKFVIYNPYIVACSYSDLQDNPKNNNSKEKQEETIKKKWNKYFDKEDRYFNKNFLKNVSNMRINPNKIK